MNDQIVVVFKALDDLIKQGKFALEDIGFMERYLSEALKSTRKLSARVGLCEVCLKAKAVGILRHIPGVIVAPGSDKPLSADLRVCAECKTKEQK